MTFSDPLVLVGIGFGVVFAIMTVLWLLGSGFVPLPPRAARAVRPAGENT